ncbi:M42 family metallopeptidase [Candidatus Acetothermia bacterium]|nr:M42 family metallopeptidase [Candidatus Acetothermia bacterium]MBI3643923.1 M42 family metallopeptidase [Candidatus Acetothermia bacterium]
MDGSLPVGRYFIMTHHKAEPTGGGSIKTIELLESLSNTFGPSGFEDEVRGLLKKLVEPLVDEVQVDALGNLIGVRQGKTKTRLMLDAHMDEIGFMISYIEEKGFLRFTTLGGWDARIIPSHAMLVRTEAGKKIKGIVGTPPPHILSEEDRQKPYKLEHLFVDIGATSAKEVEKLGIRTGSPAVISYPFEKLNEMFVCGKALDDRAGCAVILKVLEAFKSKMPDVTIYANFAICEEVGLRGARTAAYQIEPDLALALEGTVGADVPEVPSARQPSGLGKGPTISVADSSLIVNPKLVQKMSEIAKAEKIPYQYKIPPFGGTDAGAIHQSRGGALAGVLSVPCRYIHSPFSILRLDDFDETVKLATAFVKRGNEILKSCKN